MLFFTPESKVQKDRKVIRDTDLRLAKYSRRGIALNLAAYLLCTAFGEMHIQAPRLTIILVVGLVLLTLVRGFFSFRFESLYPRAPTRWRNQYFIVTLLGAVWWSVIVCSYTLTLGLHYEVPLLWLYTIVFFSTISHAMSPFRDFCLAYQFIGLFPPIIAALLTGEAEGFMYAVVMLVFLILLTHQARLVNHNYWERLAANFALSQKAKSLEAEKRDTDANIELNQEFISNLGHELRTSLNDVMGSLALISKEDLNSHQIDLVNMADKSAARQLDLVNNIMDFSRIIRRQLALDNSSFNLRQQLECWVRDNAHEAHQYAIELDYHFEDESPLRVRGDAVRLGQIVNLILTNTIKLTDTTMILVDARVELISDRNAQLQLSISNYGDDPDSIEAKHEIDSKQDEDVVPQIGRNSLWFTICKGLAECMSGELSFITSKSGQRWEYWLQIPFETADAHYTEAPPEHFLKGKTAVVFAKHEASLQKLRHEFKSWGISVFPVMSLANLDPVIDEVQSGARILDTIIFSTENANLGKMLEVVDRQAIHLASSKVVQVLFATYVEIQSEPVQTLLNKYPHVKAVPRPFIRQEFFDNLQLILKEPDAKENFRSIVESTILLGTGKTVLVVDDHKVNQLITQGMLAKLGYDVVVANNGLEALDIYAEKSPDLILMDCQMPEMDGYEATRKIRELQKSDDDTADYVPIIAMTAMVEAGSETQCLAAGMDDYMPKPVSMDVLEARMKRWLGA